MVYLNLFLQSSNKLSKADLVGTKLEGKLTTQTQFTALSMWLSNFIKYKGKTIYFVKGQMNTLPKRENPNQIGQRSINSVIGKLESVGLVKTKTGRNSFQEGENLLSTVRGNKQIVSFANKLITFEIAKQKNPPYVLLAKRKAHQSSLETSLDFNHDSYSREIERMMKEYNEFLNKQKIECEGEIISDFHLTRKYQVGVWSNKYQFTKYENPFRHGGRSGGKIANMKKELRPKIKINGKPTVQIDIPCSYLNFLYQARTGKWLERDAYDIGYPEKYRDVLKVWFQILLGSTSLGGAHGTLTNYYHNQANDKWRKLYNSFMNEIGGKENRKEVSETIINDNSEVAEYFLLGKAFQTHLQWLEANMVFNVAHQLSLAGIPCLTVHDEYIVPKIDADYVREIMYSTGYSKPELFKSKRIKIRNG